MESNSPASARSRERQPGRSSRTDRLAGLAQLSLVEHALCPLDSASSLTDAFTYRTGYFYTDGDGNRKRAAVTIRAPSGLSAADEYYLWGLLAVTFAQKDPTMELWATPHYCLRQLGCIESTTAKGGKTYGLFRASIDRLAEVSYHSDAFFNPVRGEYLDRKMGFLKYELPRDPDSSRAWRIVWDPLFFEFCKATGGRLFFDLETYRQLDPATRRLFLLLHKIFGSGRKSPRFDVRQLSVQTLGFCESIRMCDLKVKLNRCIHRLLSMQVIRLPDGASKLGDLYEKKGRAAYSIRFHAGAYFTDPASAAKPRRSRAVTDSPLHDPLQSIGFTDRQIERILKTYPKALVQVWSDVTLMAMEKRPKGFPGFKESPQAFFTHHIREAAAKRLTPPDWWHAATKKEERAASEQTATNASEIEAAYRDARERAFREFLDRDVGKEAYEQTRQMFLQLHEARLPRGEAEAAARRDADQHFESRFDFPDCQTWCWQQGSPGATEDAA